MPTTRAKIPPGRSNFFALLAVALGCLCSAAFAQRFDPAAKREVLDALQRSLTQKAYVGSVKFSQWADHEETYFDQLDRAETPETFAGVVNTALAEFGVSHANLVPPNAFKAMQRSEVVGIGVSVRVANDGLRVLRVFPDSPAAGAAISPGDIIIEIDGKRPHNADELDGDPDSIVKLRLRKLGGERVGVELSRKRLHTRIPATLTILDASGTTVGTAADAGPADTHAPRNFGLIRLPTFAEGYDQDEVKDIFIRCMDLAGLIIDLRGNGGGAVAHTLHFLSFLIIEDTPFGVSVSSPMAARYAEATGEDPSDANKVAAWTTDRLTIPANSIRPFPRPIVVLLDSGSASASELSAQALREMRGARVVGRTSAGALLISQFVPLPHGFAAQLPISDYVSIKGFRPEGVGVVPDLPPSRRGIPAGPDPYVDAALDALTASTHPAPIEPPKDP